MSYIPVVALIILIVAAILYFFGSENILVTVFGPADQGRTVFKSLKRSILPNNTLICPEDYCDTAIPDIVAPEFNFTADKLRERLRSSLRPELRLERVHTNDPAMRERYVQRSRLFGFPDTIQVEFVPLPYNRSTIALYSHAQVGFSDRRVNRKRLKRWLKRLEEIVSN